MSFGLTFDKLLLIGIVAVFLIGPDRLPLYASHLARLVRSVRSHAGGIKGRIRAELGPEFDEVEWAKLDPRQYDPRRIIREAMSEDVPAKQPGRSPALSAARPEHNGESEARQPQ